MKVTAKSRRQLQFATGSFVFLVLCVAGLLLWLSHLYHFDTDLTRNGRNSLSPASVAVVKQLKKPIYIAAFVDTANPLHDAIAKLVGAYQRANPNVHLEFVDPNTHPDRVRKAGVQVLGALQIRYDNRSAVVENPREETITNALSRLGHRGQQWLVFLSGHGERSPDGNTNFDLSQWATDLHHQGFLTRTLTLAKNPQIPENTSVLIIAGPQTQLLPAEVKAVQEYVRHGGNLLWFADPGPSYGLSPLAEQLGFEFDPGVIVDPVSQLLTRSARAIVVASYPDQPVVKGFAQETVFPDACGISLNRNQESANQAKQDAGAHPWTSSVLFDTRASAWSETGPLNQTIRYNKGKDIPGPLNIGVAFTRPHGKGQQRVVVVCDGDFLSNTFLANGGNLDLGMRLANWTSTNDAFINIPARTTVDAHLVLAPALNMGLRLVFVLFLPVGLFTTGVLIWMRRRKR